MTEQLTQKSINEAFDEFKLVWDEKVKDSGETESMFIALGMATEMLAYYQEIKEHAESKGFTMPVLKEGLEIKFNDWTRTTRKER